MTRLKVLALPTSQILSALTNTVATLGIARVAGVEEFGAIAAALVIYNVLVSINAASLGTLALLPRGDGVRPASEPANGPANPSGAHDLALPALVVALSLPIALLLGVVALFLSRGAQDANVAFAVGIVAIALPGLLLHEALRYDAIGRGRPWRAAALDAAWLAAVLPALAIPSMGARSILVLWCGAGVATALVFGVLAGSGSVAIGAGLGAARRLVRTEGARLSRLALDGALITGSTHGVSLLCAPFFGLAGLGAVRGSRTLAGPLGTVQTALGLAMLRDVAHAREKDPQGARRGAWRVALALSAAILVFAGLAMLVPSSLGRALLGETWNGASTLLPWVLLGMASQSLAFPAQAFLRSAPDGANALLVVRLQTSCLMIAGAFAGAVLGGATGFVIGHAAARWASVPIWVRVERRAIGL